jgi:hypothetical protein
MSYDFDFDLSRVSQPVLDEIENYIDQGLVPERVQQFACKIIAKFNLEKLTGLPLGEITTIVEDLILILMSNKRQEHEFKQTNKRVLFLPHCCRKHMDSHCKAVFDKETASYKCCHCSPDCQVSQATKLAEKHGYDTFVLPGGSCVKKIFRKKKYEGIVGVACTEEIALATRLLESFAIPIQGVPLLKNGCAGTRFNLQALQQVMVDK